MRQAKQAAVRLVVSVLAAALVAAAGANVLKPAIAASAANTVTAGISARTLSFLQNIAPEPEAGDAEQPGQRSAASDSLDAVVLTVRTSRTAAYEAREELPSRGLRRALENAAQHREDAPQSRTRTERLDTFVSWPGTNGTYAVDEDGSVVDLAAGVRLQLSERWRRELRSAQERVRARFYGVLLPWSEAKAAVPRMAKFDVIDLETGLTFQAQRRAGSAHADVQPLTKNDSATMKRIYGGSWSWDRRAVLLRYDNRLFAASMNGMPHGGDGIPGNGFNGHFCIHFLDSMTHGKANIDLAHQTMIHRAAGKLPSFLRGLSPYQISELFVIAYNQQDRQLLDMLAAEGDAQTIVSDAFRDRRVKLLRVSEPLPRWEDAERFETGEPSVAWTMHVTLYEEGSSRGRGADLTFDLVRSPSEGWLIRSISL
ncbi:hypothetical protein [Gordoniibacillus kamchatkensis]|uniref:hypothetical protein n=1 Tax=Gordoniibacillus kamchatkensis TaxID=1590651 RepID=UPI0006990374|nr:hypothetical protein [Paenibacillus sp. VKM B-2647]